MLFRTLTDSQRGTLGYGGPPVALNIRLCIDDVKRDIHCPSGQALGGYRSAFRNDASFHAFVQNIILQPTGSALDGRLTWAT